ncbi:hypothetical protein FOA43_002127 [Brettanomyces nanus]|uniref:Cytochrome b mRNA-processing protein 4 n=1 Tax=Eeniella nana TaxID=13502 RepID=A0A875S1K1_EENNA|nr:uncharacterized protein FOA43_002127 [Brettanomyces nanus]QPG74793.1 hypothetical protein FOA43_002127 [Brettanomyces nanus]
MDPITKTLLKKSLIWGGGIIGLGVVLFKFTTPSPEQMLAQMSPELRADVEKNRELRMKEQEELIKVVKRTSASNDPIWKTGDIQSPWDPDFKKTSESMLVKKQAIEKARAEEKTKLELESMKEEAKRREGMEKEGMKKASGGSKWWW